MLNFRMKYSHKTMLHSFMLLLKSSYNKKLLFISLINLLLFSYSNAIFAQTTTSNEQSKIDKFGLRGMPPCPYPRTFEQPDGSTFQGNIVGNMHLFYVETLDGYTILKDASDGYYKYAVNGLEGDLFLTNVKVTEITDRRPAENVLLNSIATHARYEGQTLAKKKQKPA